MKYREYDTILASYEVKSAALYFEKVVPLLLGDFQDEDKDEIFDKIISKLVPPHLLDTTNNNSLSDGYTKFLAEDYLAQIKYWHMFASNPPGDAAVLDAAKKHGLSKEHVPKIQEVIYRAFSGFKTPKDFLIHAMKITQDYQLMKHPMLSSVNDELTEPTENDVNVSLLNLKLIDPNSASWEQILSFREDKESQRKLRNLRLFMFNEYENKSKNYIEDDINKRIDDYNHAIKDWGFNTRNAVLTYVFKLNGVIPAAITALATKLFSTSNLAAIAAGAVMQIGIGLLEFQRGKYSLHRLKRDDPLGYIIDAKEILEK